MVLSLHIKAKINWKSFSSSHHTPASDLKPHRNGFFDFTTMNDFINVVSCHVLLSLLSPVCIFSYIAVVVVVVVVKNFFTFC